MTLQPQTAVGTPQSRVDGRLKVTGRAPYAADHGAEEGVDNVRYAVVVDSTVARWDGDNLTVWDKTQWVVGGTQTELAAVFGIPQQSVRVISPFVGGGFGSGLRAWPHTTIAALAARVTGLPVKLVLSRRQMYFGTGFRPAYTYALKVAGDRRGQLTAMVHDVRAETSSYETFTEAVLVPGQMLYSMPHVRQAYSTVPLDVNTPIWMRGPGFATGTQVIECAMDELAHELGVDPIELRLRNEPGKDPSTGLPFSTRRLRECYQVGAREFGWHRRNPKPGVTRDGDWLIGTGMAAAVYDTGGFPAQAHVRLNADGTALVQSATSDMGPGTYTSMPQVAADALGLTDAPEERPHRGETYQQLLTRNQRPHLEAIGTYTGAVHDRFSMSACGAVFAEIAVDARLGIVRLRRMLGVYDAGKIVNPKLADSQAIGGMVGGIGAALLPHCCPEPTAVLIRRGGESGCQRPDMLDKLRGFVHPEVEPFGRHVDGQLVQRVRPGPQGAAVLVDRLQRSGGGGDPLRRGLGADVQGEPGLVAVGRRGDRPRGVAADIGIRWGARGEAGAGGRARVEAVHAVGAPVPAVDVPADEIPAPARVHQSVGLGRADAGGSVVGSVVEAQAQRVAAGGGDGGERARVDGGAGVGHRHRHRPQGVDPVAQPGRQYLFKLGQGPHRSLLDAGDRTAGGRAQAHRDRDGFVVVEQQRRQIRTGAQPVAGGARGGLHGVAEAAQPVDVAAHGARSDLQSFGQFGAGPVTSGLQEREQSQQACGGFPHGSKSATVLGPNLT